MFKQLDQGKGMFDQNKQLLIKIDSWKTIDVGV